MKHKGVVIVLLILFVSLGIGVMFYPYMAARYARQVRSEIQTAYAESLNETDKAELEQERMRCREYNEKLAEGSLDILQPEENGYYTYLSAGGSNVMGFVRIPSICVELPIYHGIGEDALQKGAGHLPQSSLPVGGENSHAVLSAHTGMASSPMFSDLELLKIGELFYVDVLGETLTYEIDSIRTVLPEDVEAIRIHEGMDEVTLVTCTPFGVNTHRLLVTGHRIETEQDEPAQIEEKIAKEESVWQIQYRSAIRKGCLWGSGAFAGILAIAFLIGKGRRKKNA